MRIGAGEVCTRTLVGDYPEVELGEESGKVLEGLLGFGE